MSTPKKNGFHFSSEKRESWFEKFQKRKRDRTQLEHSDWLSLSTVKYDLKWLVLTDSQNLAYLLSIIIILNFVKILHYFKWLKYTM